MFVTATVSHVHKDLIIIQKLIIMHTYSHTHTHRTAVLFTKSTAASRQSAVVVQLQQAAAVAESWLQRGQGTAVTTAAAAAGPAGSSSINSRNAYYNNW